MRDFHLPGRSEVLATNGMCATSHPLAAKVAVSILEDGGNAVDAAIAGAVVLGLCEPHMTGIGGDLFALVKPAGSEEIVALNGSGRAPMNTSAAALREKGHKFVPTEDPAAITIPGAVDAFCTLSSDYGLKGLDAVLAPAIRYAEEGIPVAPRVAMDWAASLNRLDHNGKRFFSLAGTAPKAGQRFAHPQMAEVLRKIASNGRSGFYEGEVAEDMVAALNALGGVHQLQDFADNQPRYDTPISGSYREYELVEHPPNTQGAAAILLAHIMSQFDLSQYRPFSTERAHIEAEATKIAYTMRQEVVADPDHVTRLTEMLDPAYGAEMAAQIDLKRAKPNLARPTETQHTDTVYITVVDRDRMAVSLIYSIFKEFGSGRASPKYGILLHNRGAGFNLADGHVNELAPGKRPMHTIAPAMLRQDGRVIAPFGVMGGQYQATGHARVLGNIVDYGMGLQEALDGPRCFEEFGKFKVERGYSDQVRQDLVELGHQVVTPDTPIGGAQMIRIDHETGVLEGASDPRKDGCALGY